jgi:hypothetical protein
MAISYIGSRRVCEKNITRIKFTNQRETNMYMNASADPMSFST